MSSPDLISRLPEPRILGKGWAIGTAASMAVVIGIALAGYGLKIWSGGKAVNGAIISIGIAQLLYVGVRGLGRPTLRARLIGLLVMLPAVFFLAVLLNMLGVFAWPAWIEAYVIKPFAVSVVIAQWLFFAAILLVMLPNPFRWLTRRRVDPSMGVD
jgi:hypothetical protein